MLLARYLRSAVGSENVLCVFVDRPKDGLAAEILAECADLLITTDYNENKDAVKYTLQNTHVIIDCVFGFGFHGDFDGKIAELFDFINRNCKALKFSVDLPSGVNADTGQQAEYTFVPDVTLILAACKKGLLAHPRPCNSYVLLDIGLIESDYTEYETQFTDSSILSKKRERSPESHKGTHGRLLNIAGSERYIGAALLSAKAAVKSGAGLVTLAAPERVITAIAAAVPEAVFVKTDHGDRIKLFTQELKTADAIAIGCGMGNTPETRKITEFVVKNASCPVILDADGINSISDNINVLNEHDKLHKSSLILTPHPGEFSRLTGLSVAEIQANRLDTAQIFAKESGAVVVLKGMNTVIASPTGEVLVNPTGNAGLAKAGTGDVLTGIIGGLCAQGIEPFQAAALGVYLHGLAADVLAKSMPLSKITASDIIENI
jgi:NAD(P)H-hydrate epimerase